MGVVNEDIRLTLPPHGKVKDLRWLSVWCRAFNANFGELMFPDNYNGDVDVKSDDGYEITTSLADDEDDNATTIATTMVNMTTVEVTTEEENPSPHPIIEKMLPPTTVKNIDQLTNTGQVAFPNLVIFIIVLFVL